MSLLKFKTVDAGEEVIIYNYKGEAKAVKGPARLTLWRSRMLQLKLFYADENEYLEVNCRDAPKLNIPGPCQLFENPVKHHSILVKGALLLNANEVLIVYSSDHGDMDGDLTPEKMKKSSVERSILHGPIKYIPKPNEWVHQFSWHGTDPSDKTKKVPGGTNFTKMRVVADKLYYNVREVRTKDDTQIVVKLMIFFQLTDIEKMLDSTYDPVADMINAVCADIIQYCATLSYVEFVEQTSALNQLDSFPQLITRTRDIGYTVNKVVFRGFHASDALQRMHDNAIQERTRLRLEADTEDHRQARLDFQLAKEEERSAREQELEKQRALHKQNMQLEEHRFNLEREKEVQEERIRIRREELSLEERRIQKMVELGLDTTAILVAETGKPDRRYRIETAADAEKPISLHVHDSN